MTYKRILFILLLYFVSTIKCDTGGINPAYLSKCKIHYSKSESSYTNFFRITEDLRNNTADLLLDFHFAVMAPSDAHILVSPSNKIQKSDPVYEIVLGAGSNSFSDIRRLQKSSVKRTTRTKDLLSSFEPRMFWLHISKDGLIEVGRANEELAFLSYRDPSPLPVEVFSFNTWPGIEAKWFYGCPRNNSNDTEDTTEIKKPLTDFDRLKKRMLLQYDPYARPVLNEEDLTIINLHFFYDRIDMDERKAIMSLQGSMLLQWRDEKIFWTASDYGNITKFHLYFREIWQPNLIIYNSASGTGSDFLKSTMIEVDSDGWVTWKAFVDNLQVWCDPAGLSGKHWPADEHTCEVQLGPMPDHYLVNIVLYDSVKNSEWKILSNSTDIRFIPNGNYDLELQVDYDLQLDVDVGVDYRAYVMKFEIKRNSHIYTAVYYAPIIAIAVSMLLTFCMSAEEPYRISLNCLQLILLFLLFANLSLKMPPYYSVVPNIVVLYTHGLYGAILCLVISVIIINLTRVKQKRDLPDFLCAIVASYYFRTMVKFEFTKSSESYDNLQADNVSVCSLEKQEAWIMFAKLIDRVFFVIYAFMIVFHLCRNY